MKKLNLNILIALFILSGVFVSCDEKMNELTSINVTDNIVGTYSGTLTTENSLKSGRSANVDITLQADSSVQVYCYSEDFDTTIVFDMYQNGDSVMLCFTGQDFYNEYGQNQSNSWNDMCHDNWMGSDYQMCNWDDHMSTEHNFGDIHYANFDLNSNMFNCIFKIQTDTSTYFENFVGEKISD